MTDGRSSPAPLEPPRVPSRLLRPLAVTFLIAASLAAFWGYLQTGTPRSTFDRVTAMIGTGSGLDIGFDLVDHHGRNVTVADFSGTPLFVVFGYTSCPDVCPTTLSRVATVLDDLDRAGVSARGVFITLDPARDTPGHLASYVAAFHPRLTGLFGDEPSVKDATRKFRVYYEKAGDDADDYLIDHSAYIYLLGNDGTLLSYYHPDLAADVLSKDVRSRLQVAM